MGVGAGAAAPPPPGGAGVRRMTRLNSLGGGAGRASPPFGGDNARRARAWEKRRDEKYIDLEMGRGPRAAQRRGSRRPEAKQKSPWAIPPEREGEALT